MSILFLRNEIKADDYLLLYHSKYEITQLKGLFHTVYFGMNECFGENPLMVEIQQRKRNNEQVPKNNEDHNKDSENKNKDSENKNKDSENKNKDSENKNKHSENKDKNNDLDRKSDSGLHDTGTVFMSVIGDSMRNDDSRGSDSLHAIDSETQQTDSFNENRNIISQGKAVDMKLIKIIQFDRRFNKEKREISFDEGLDEDCNIVEENEMLYCYFLPVFENMECPMIMVLIFPERYHPRIVHTFWEFLLFSKDSQLLMQEIIDGNGSFISQSMDSFISNDNLERFIQKEYRNVPVYPLPTDIQDKLDEQLTNLEVSPNELDIPYSIAPRNALIVGGCCFYQGRLLVSHLTRIHTEQIYSFLSTKSMLHRTKNHSESVIHCKVNCTEQDPFNILYFNDARKCNYHLSAIAHENLALCILFQIYDQELDNCNKYYLPELRQTFTQISNKIIPKIHESCPFTHSIPYIHHQISQEDLDEFFVHSEKHSSSFAQVMDSSFFKQIQTIKLAMDKYPISEFGFQEVGKNEWIKGKRFGEDDCVWKASNPFH